ncbi:MAG: HAMP domain-containing sensor histidine kinase [Pseudomonadota bacterium]
MSERRPRRPPIRAVLILMLLIAVMTPMVGLFFFRVFENQLIRKTEAELIAQSAAIAAVYRREAQSLPDAAFGAEAPWEVKAGYFVAFSPYGASLDLASDPILPPRPEATPAPPLDPAYGAIGDALEPVIEETRRRTLAAIQLLDPNGVVMTGDEVGRSLAHVPEVAIAVDGALARQLRTRLRERPPSFIYNVTKGASLRVFIAFPVLVKGRVAGVVYASRTPAHILQVAWAERESLALAAAATLMFALILGLIAARTITGPIRRLTARTRAISAGEREAMAPLARPGTAEVEELSETFLRTSRKLHDRSASTAAFAAHVSHELKSPLTAIQGAVELIRETPDMPAEDRAAFLGNIAADGERMTMLVRRLLELARAETDGASGETTVAAAAAEVSAAEAVDLIGDVDARLAVPADKLTAVLSALCDNARRHGAERVEVSVRARNGRARIVIADDGAGISPGNDEKLFEPFFTTRRESGGTGMGLSIARALIEAHDGSIWLEAAQGPLGGAAFGIDAPLAG